MALVEGIDSTRKPPLGSEVNPVVIQSDRALAWTNLILRVLATAAGGLGAEVPNVTEDGRTDHRVVPSEIEGEVLDRELKAKVKPGQWFYFSTDPSYLFKQGPRGRPVEFRRRGTRDPVYITYPNQPPIA